MLQNYPCINDFGEIDWRYEPRNLVQELSLLGLASYDWAAQAYVTVPTTAALVQRVAEFAGQNHLTIHPNEKFGLSVTQPHGLVEYFFLKRLEMSHSSVYLGKLEKPLNRALSPYQQAAVVYAVHTHCCFIADPEPSDRQIAALASNHQVRGYPCVLICQKNDFQEWMQLIQEYLPGNTHIVNAQAVNSQTPSESIWLLDYNSLEHDIGLPTGVRSYFSVIVDHAHFIKNSTASRTTLTAAIARRVNYCFLLTDFPINLSPSDLREPLQILGKQNEFDALDRFLDQVNSDPLGNRELRWRNTNYQRKLTALYRKLRSTCLVRRAYDPGLRIQQNIQHIETGPIPTHIDPDDVRSDLRWLGLKKVGQAIEWLRQFLSGHKEKVLIFAHHNNVVEEIAAALNIPAIYGKVADENQRSEIAASLARPNGEQALVVASDVELIWDFSSVSALVFVELLITPRQLHNFVNHVLGQNETRALSVHLLCSDHPLDWQALKRLELRLDDYDRVLDGVEPIS